MDSALSWGEMWERLDVGGLFGSAWGGIRVSNHHREYGELPGGGTCAPWAFLAPGRGLGTILWPRPVCSEALVVSQPEPGLLFGACLGAFKPSSPFPRLVGFAIQMDVAMDSHRLL